MHLYCSFSLQHQMAPLQSTKFRTACFHEFCSSLRKDSITNHGLMWKQFPPVCIENDAGFSSSCKYGAAVPQDNALEMCMGMGFPMGPGIPWEWE